MTAITQRPLIFDQDHYVELIEARGSFLRRFLPQLKQSLDLKSALDAGCGVGFFSELLRECGLEVQAFDGRESNITEANRRYPGIHFRQGDIEDSSITHLGSFDLALCFGLLYHLENPLRAIRHLHSLTRKVLLLESMCLPTNDLQIILREEPDSADQSLTQLALYASEGCITKMLFRAGFRFVYRIAVLPDHDEFRDTTTFTRRRTVILASLEPVVLSGLTQLDEPRETAYPWRKILPLPPRSRRIKKFLRAPLKDKYLWLVRRAHSYFPHAPLPIRLPFGAWWLARNDHISKPLLAGDFEAAERTFVQNFLKLGMTVVDVGAHHGLYALLAAKCVGSEGRVIAFEPSPRERKALRLNILINRLRNISIQGVALANEDSEANLYVVQDYATGCNSLRSPAPDVLDEARPVSVPTNRLDSWLASANIDHVDFIKLDVEGAELAVLQGATNLLQRQQRPVILAEVQDVRTRPWGYRAREIVIMLERFGYVLFQPTKHGELSQADTNTEDFDLNLVAIPEELVRSVLARVNAPKTVSENEKC